MINGIDISKWQGVMNWAKAKTAGVEFAIIRAGSIDANTGVCYTDFQLKNNVDGCKAQGIPYSLYWFFRPNLSAVEQAEYFIKLADESDLGSMAISLWCDIEVVGRADVVKAFVELLSNKYRTGIYTNPNTALYLLTGEKGWMSWYPLWLADWTPPASIPAPWKEYAVWQYAVKPDGIAFGAQSASIDHDYGQDWIILPAPVPQPDALAERVKALEELTLSMDQVLDRHGEWLTDLEARVKKLEAAPPVSTAKFKIGSSQALARCIDGYNAAGKPIMSIYPSDNAPVDQRVKWAAGTLLDVEPVPVTADGGGKYFKQVSHGLYARAQDGALVV